ncbi:TPA: hypothetical protein DEW05_05530 [Candidatus Saccharibacteria bacterium]|nr:hypothetical protein [Candidatus Saccharibacteria bacterium]
MMAQPTPPYKASTEHTTASGQPTPPQQSASSAEYENNPFFVGLNGFTRMFAYAKSLAIIFLVMSIAGFIANMTQERPEKGEAGEAAATPAIDSITIEQILFIAGIASVFVLGIVLISVFINGLSSYASYAVAAQRKVTFQEAIKAVAKRYPAYFLMQLIIFIKVLLWTLLLIVPGIIMSIRYSLAGTSFFAKDLSAKESIKHSLTLTKGGWMTTFASYVLISTFRHSESLQASRNPVHKAYSTNNLILIRSQTLRNPEHIFCLWL